MYVSTKLLQTIATKTLYYTVHYIRVIIFIERLYHKIERFFLENKEKEYRTLERSLAFHIVNKFVETAKFF